MENIYDFEEKCGHHPVIVRECSRKLVFQGGALGKNAIPLKDKSMTFERTRVQNESRTDSKFFLSSIYLKKTTSYILVKTVKSLWLLTLTPLHCLYKYNCTCELFRILPAVFEAWHAHRSFAPLRIAHHRGEVARDLLSEADVSVEWTRA